MRTIVRAACLGLLLSPAAATGQGQDSVWLATKGFWQRAPDALLHADARGIRDFDTRRLREVLEALPRVEVRELEGDRYFVLHASEDWTEPEASAPCVLTFWLNGGPVTSSRGRPADVSVAERTLDLRRLDGLEVYATEASPIGAEGTCGSVLGWSRRISTPALEDFVGHLRGRAMLMPDNRPAGGIEIRVEPGGHTQKTSSAGWFDFGAVLPGRYELTASAAGDSTTSVIVVRAYAISQFVVEIQQH